MIHRRLAFISLAALALTLQLVSAQDWPQWRGPGRDGSIAAFREPATWPKTLTKQWNAEIGLGYATPLVVGNRIFVFTRQGDNEVMTALDAASAKVLWRTSYAAPFRMNPATAPHGPGPKSTPTFAANRLFTLGMSGIVTAFDASTGRQIWQKPGGPVEPMFHTAMSPLVVGNLVVFHVGGHDNGALTAFDVATGEVRWSWNGDGPAYGSPLLFNLSGTPQVVTSASRSTRGGCSGGARS
jgi:outer membrane protein assembly factor BamB